MFVSVSVSAVLLLTPLDKKYSSYLSICFIKEPLAVPNFVFCVTCAYARPTDMLPSLWVQLTVSMTSQLRSVPKPNLQVWDSCSAQL